ncbi:MAG: queuosine precursor transporter [Patescibacteria group bacterium]
MKAVHKLDFLFAIYIFCIVATELMGAKTFPLTNFSWMHLNASVAIFLFPIVFSINDIVIEVYGKERARNMMQTGLMVVFFTFVFAALATALPPSARFGGTESAYDKIFQSSMRISGASLIAFGLAQFTDIFIFAKIRERLGKKALWLRNNASNFAAQLLDTILFISLAFYNFARPFEANVGFLISLIVPYWLLKCAMSVIETPFVYLGVNWLKKGK